jgi:hypothetical protein
MLIVAAFAFIAAAFVTAAFVAAAFLVIVFVIVAPGAFAAAGAFGTARPVSCVAFVRLSHNIFLLIF